jgi:hypothetical protein
MPGKPLDPQPSRQPAFGSGTSGAGTSESASPHAADRAGALDIKRHVKDDGRALILYSHVEDSAAGAAAERG